MNRKETLYQALRQNELRNSSQIMWLAIGLFRLHWKTLISAMLMVNIPLLLMVLYISSRYFATHEIGYYETNRIRSGETYLLLLSFGLCLGAQNGLVCAFIQLCRKGEPVQLKPMLIKTFETIPRQIGWLVLSGFSSSFYSIAFMAVSLVFGLLFAIVAVMGLVGFMPVVAFISALVGMLVLGHVVMLLQNMYVSGYFEKKNFMEGFVRGFELMYQSVYSFKMSLSTGFAVMVSYLVVIGIPSLLFGIISGAGEFFIPDFGISEDLSLVIYLLIMGITFPMAAIIPITAMVVSYFTLYEANRSPALLARIASVGEQQDVNITKNEFGT